MTVSSQDIDQMRQLATQLSSRAGAIETNFSQLTTGLTAVNWPGPDAIEFKAKWSGTHLPALRAAVAALREAAQQATRDADEHARANAAG